MIPITLIAGFLGCGKTTLLAGLAKRHADRRLVFLVNEFSSADIDGQRLAGAGDRLLSVSGGSIFCRCRITDFLEALRSIPERFGSTDRPVEGIVVEASGMANPKAAAALLAESRLDRTYALARILAVTDPGSFPKLIRTLPALRHQIEAADRILVNKCDLFPEPQIRETEAEIRALRPDARVERAIRGAADADLLGPAAPRPAWPDARPAPCVDPRFAAGEARAPEPVDLARLEAAIRARADSLYRLKGFVPLAGGGWADIDYSLAGFRAEPAPAPPRDARLAVIARGETADALADFTRRIERGEFSARHEADL